MQPRTPSLRASRRPPGASGGWAGVPHRPPLPRSAGQRARAEPRRASPSRRSRSPTRARRRSARPRRTTPDDGDVRLRSSSTPGSGSRPPADRRDRRASSQQPRDQPVEARQRTGCRGHRQGEGQHPPAVAPIAARSERAADSARRPIDARRWSRSSGNGRPRRWASVETTTSSPVARPQQTAASSPIPAATCAGSPASQPGDRALDALRSVPNSPSVLPMTRTAQRSVPGDTRGDAHRRTGAPVAAESDCGRVRRCAADAPAPAVRRTAASGVRGPGLRLRAASSTSSMVSHRNEARRAACELLGDLVAGRRFLRGITTVEMPAQGGQGLLAHAADRQHPTAQRDLARHRHVRARTAMPRGQRGNQRGRDRGRPPRGRPSGIAPAGTWTWTCVASRSSRSSTPSASSRIERT